MRTFSANGEPLRHYTDGFCGWAIVSEAGRIRYEMIECVRGAMPDPKEGSNGAVQNLRKQEMRA